MNLKIKTAQTNDGLQQLKGPSYLWFLDVYSYPWVGGERGSWRGRTYDF